MKLFHRNEEPLKDDAPQPEPQDQDTSLVAQEPPPIDVEEETPLPSVAEEPPSIDVEEETPLPSVAEETPLIDVAEEPALIDVAEEPAPIDVAKEPSPASPQPSVLKVAARSRPSSVAGAIAGVVRETGRAEVQSIGAGATNQAIKSIAVARSYLQEDGIDIVCIPGFTEVLIEEEERTAIRLVIEKR